MDDVMCEGYWSEADLEFIRISITTKFVDDALIDFGASFVNRDVANRERSGHALVKKLQWQVGFKLIIVDDRAPLPKANLIIIVVNLDKSILKLPKVSSSAMMYTRLNQAMSIPWAFTISRAKSMKFLLQNKITTSRMNPHRIASSGVPPL
ncbi:hypothetical protein PanWU01x14_109530 [Parasponia andersonii]|uniref:Uncharacterized protein n=1 Tax=Parasponia andersonii TaxID=3476 RepID=A0A2P5CZR7_PARAD|nr:hypothetical protein PanWU01x14_109530 [Parasponia andersonii]